MFGLEGGSECCVGRSVVWVGAALASERSMLRMAAESIEHMWRRVRGSCACEDPMLLDVMLCGRDVVWAEALMFWRAECAEPFWNRWGLGWASVAQSVKTPKSKVVACKSKAARRTRGIVFR